MTSQFSSGYALLIAVNENSVPKWSLPIVGKDVDALAQVLTHPERCAYPQGNVKVVSGKNATRQGILDGLTWLTERLRADTNGNATAVIYYSGHGWRDTSTSAPTYYLIPYDIRENAARLTALRASDFADAVEGLTPRRLLVILDCCHAGGMDVKEIDLAGMEAKSVASAAPGYVGSAIPAVLFMGTEKAVVLDEDSKEFELLAQGAGRAVLSSSQGDQSSYVRKDGAMSIFTYHLIEALTGHAQPAEGASEVLVSDVMSYVTRHVPESAQQDCGKEQIPDFQISGYFPVALILGGKGVSKGMAPPDPLMPLAPQPLQAARKKIVYGDEVHGNQVGGVHIGKVNGGIHGAVIAGGDVRNVNLGGATTEASDPVAQIPALLTLRNLLSSLYETEQDAQRIAQDAGLDTRQIDFTGKAVNIWHQLLAEAHKQGKVKAVVGNATMEYPAQSEDLRKAYQAYTVHH